MAKQNRPPPTEAELAILHVLWARGPSTVRDVHEALSARGTGYTTVLKTLQIMADKRLVTRDTAERSHVYAAAVDESRTKGGLVKELIDRAFSGSAADLVVRALAVKPASAEEIGRIRALLDELDDKGSR